MKKMVSIVFLLLLSACSAQRTIYIYQLPHSLAGKQCIAQCNMKKHICEQKCLSRDLSCRLHARQQAYFNFQHYQKIQMAKGLKIKKGLGDFDQSYFQCGQSCHCVSYYNSCYKGCGGTVKEKTVN